MTENLGATNLAASQAERWRNNHYYDDAESKMERQWTGLVEPFIRGSDFTTTIDLAAGHGRNSQFLLPLANKLYIIDIHKENVDFCRNRFLNAPNITYIVNNGASLNGIADSSVTLVYCFDAMVHFHSDVVREYLREFRRVLRPGGRAFCHHSNSMIDPGGLVVQRHLKGRNFMSREYFMHYCVLEGFNVLKSIVIDWAGEKSLDCLTYFEKPA